MALRVLACKGGWVSEKVDHYAQPPGAAMPKTMGVCRGHRGGAGFAKRFGAGNGRKTAAMDGPERYAAITSGARESSAAMTWAARHGCAFFRRFRVFFAWGPRTPALAAARPCRSRGRAM